MPNVEDLMRSGIDRLGQLKEKDLFVFSVYFGNEAGEALDAFTIRTAGRPKVSNEPYEVDFLNNKRKYKGKTTYEDIDITLSDPIQPAASRKVWNWILRHYDPETGMAGYKSTYAAREARVESVSPAGTVVETWVLHNVWVSNADFGDLDYSTKEPQEISLTLTYDYPILEKVTT